MLLYISIAKFGAEIGLARKFRFMKKTVFILGPSLDGMTLLVYPRVQSAFIPAWYVKCLAMEKTGQSASPPPFLCTFVIPLTRLPWSVCRDIC